VSSPGLGARPGAGGTHVEVWAPFATRVEVELVTTGSRHPLEPAADGYHRGVVPARAGDRYLLALDGSLGLPDPASRHQPDGVHGPSEVVDPSVWRWTDGGWPGLALDGLVVYECHVGTLTPGGTFDAAIGELDRLAELGVTAVELMPVAQFPGGRNWGYDGVLAWAVQDTYGGPAGLARFVDAAHQRGLGVLLDVVYNHVGPEGNVLGRYGPYFTDRYRTPWGEALNFDGPGSDEVRRYFVESAVAFVIDHHVDGFRLDAVHAIVDPSSRPFVEELREAVADSGRQAGRRVLVIAESSANDPRLVRREERGGMGLDAVWNDDFHHALRVALTGERREYYVDFDGAPDLVRALGHGYVYTGQRSAFRGRRHGRPADGVPSRRFIAFSTNHDHVGNRPAGDRLDHSIGLEARKLAPTVVLLSPFTPLLFMGEEYGERRPFPYFVSHTDPELLDAVRRGRRAEFAGWEWGGRGSGGAMPDPADGGVPDPADEATFRSAVIDPSQRLTGDGAVLWALYRRLLELRREVPVLADPGAHTRATHEAGTVVLRRTSEDQQAVVVLRFAPDPAAVVVPPGPWRLLLDTAATEWAGPGTSVPPTLPLGQTEITLAPWSAVLLVSGGRRHDEEP
jgi:maltooligosyltrehalose trehalohydrolase